MFSFQKAFLICPSLSVNGIFDDVSLSDMTSSQRDDIAVLG